MSTTDISPVPVEYDANADGIPEHHGAIPVCVVDDVREELEGSDLQSFQTYVLSATVQPFRILPQDNRRKRAVISGISGANLTILCKQNQVAINQQQGVNAVAGFQIISGMSLVYEGKGEVWCVPVGVLTISVLDERWSPR